MQLTARNCGPRKSARRRFTPPARRLLSDGLCIAQIGGGRNGGPGGITAYDLNTGEEKWKWAGDGAAYASPVLVTIGNTKVIVAVTASKLVAVNAADGKGLWEIICRQLRYQSASPVVDGQTVIYAGPMQGLTATTLALQSDTLMATERWRQPESSLMYNTPVVCGAALYGISGTNNLFCLNAATGDLAWTTPIANPGATAQIATAAGQRQPAGRSSGPRPRPRRRESCQRLRLGGRRRFGADGAQPRRATGGIRTRLQGIQTGGQLQSRRRRDLCIPHRRGQSSLCEGQGLGGDVDN